MIVLCTKYQLHMRVYQKFLASYKQDTTTVTSLFFLHNICELQCTYSKSFVQFLYSGLEEEFILPTKQVSLRGLSALQLPMSRQLIGCFYLQRRDFILCRFHVQ